MPLSIPFPAWLKPEIIPGLPFRWYGLMYIIAFGVAYWLYRRQVKERNFPISEEDLTGLFFWGIMSLVLGARIFATIVYETSDIYRKQPWLVFWPFQNGRFTGLQGMSYHGGVIGGIAAILVYSARKHFDYREIGDMFAASIPLGYTFGRLGNFINGELFGRITAGRFGMVFPMGEISPLSPEYAAVREGAELLGFPVPRFGEVMNLPRYPSQLFEALFEGLILWAIIWFFRNRKPFKGFLIGLYLAGYGVFRFFIEYFREPDADLGYRIELVPNGLPPAVSHPLTSFSTGQIFSFLMAALGLVWFFIAAKLPDHEPVRVYTGEAVNQGGRLNKDKQKKKEQEKKRRRKLRKKLR
ncbi:MAG: prolipoprotein diacylglyceryl transferase [Treponema sp.]|jgi:phosphatidylglycerol:prolipoprotein diacylglycerol transferase|nr:prolipoprotein diacylglyceryl transferase [Treponema sp.]